MRTDGSKKDGMYMKKQRGYPLPMGATVEGNWVNFSVSAPEKSCCELLLYKKGETTPVQTLAMEEDVTAGCIRHIAVSLGVPGDYEYNYQIDGTVVPDLYGKDFAGRHIWNQEQPVEEHVVRTKIVSDVYDWEGDKPLRIPYREIIAYSLHVRGFTKHVSSKVKHKGTFMGIIEKIPYLLELGINQIQCMPAYDFEENLKYTNYWGYGDGYFFAPKSSYAATGDAVTEFKLLVKSLHRAGIELVLEMPFDMETGETTMIDCLRYYVMEYHIDGFIVNPARITMEALRRDPILAHTKIMKKQDIYQNTMRRFLKGDEGMVSDVMWWLKRQSEEEGIFNYVAGHNGFTLNDVFSYDGKHNEANGENNQDGPDFNYSWNCGAEGPSRKKTVVELRRKQIRNAFFILLLSQGTPCILAGDEFGNTQKGNNNVYCQDNATAWLDWSRIAKEEELLSFVKGLISFRKQHKLLYPDKEMKGIDYTSCGVPDISYHGENAWRAPSEIASRQLGVYISGQNEKEALFTAYNMHWLPHTFALPTLPKGKHWYETASTQEGVLEVPRLLKNAREVKLEERTIKVFIGK